MKQHIHIHAMYPYSPRAQYCLALLVFLYTASLVFPNTTYANTESLTFMPPQHTAGVGDTVAISAELQVSDEPGINALESSISVTGPAQVVAIQTGGSLFSLWPTLDIQNGTRAHIIGGTPSSVFGNHLKAYEVVLRITGAGVVTVVPEHVVVYLGDGTGAPQAVRAEYMSFTSVKQGKGVDEYAARLTRDTHSPASFSISLARDTSVFSGAYFLSFTTTDAETGVQKYEVIEGTSAPVVSDGTYVLKDQSLSTRVVVRAYDAAGNIREETFTPPGALPWLRWVYVAAALSIAGMMIGVILRYVRRRRTI